MNTYQELKLTNGQQVKLTLTLKNLLRLKSIDIKLYKEVSRIITKGPEDALEDMPRIVYAGYICGLEPGNSQYDFETFLDLIPDSIGEISNIAAELISPKKK